MKTKSHVRFLNRAAHYDADVELADVLAIAIKDGCLSIGATTFLFDQVDPLKHPRLAARTSNATNRGIAISHLKATICSSFLKDIYEDLTAYFSEILEAAARNGLDPGRLIGEHGVQFKANDILRAGNWNAVVHLVARSVFRQMEGEKSTKDLIAKMNNKLALGVNQSTVDNALPYLEMRHLLVHADGIADADFCSSFPGIGVSPGTKIPLNINVLKAARSNIFALVQEFDTQVVTHNVVGAADLNG